MVNSLAKSQADNCAGLETLSAILLATCLLTP